MQTEPRCGPGRPGGRHAGPPGDGTGRVGSRPAPPRPVLLGSAGVRVGLGLLWLAAGILELQPADFGAGFARLDLAQAVMGEPAVVARSILLALRPFEAAWPVWNGVVAAVELGFGAVLVAGGLVALRGGGTGRAARAAGWLAGFERPIVVASALAALVFWWVGEGFGGLPTGFAVPLGGAPGPALLYAFLAVLAWPGPAGGETVEAWRRTTWRLSWLVVWWGSALAMVSWTLPAAVVLRANLVENAIGQPALLRGWGDALASAITRVGANQVALAVGLVAVAIGLAAVLPLGSTASCLLLGSGVLLGVLAWVFAQDLGGLASPGGTDVGLGPPLVLLALAGWPRSASARPRAAAPEPEAQPAGPAVRDRRGQPDPRAQPAPPAQPAPGLSQPAGVR